jgi:hypothetical protein
MKHQCLGYILTFLMLCPLFINSACAQKNTDLLFLLSDRHHVPGIESLQKNYSSTDDLIEDLLLIRLTEYPPFAAIRAETLLIEFSDREEVVSHLEEDLEHPERTGLARVIIRNLEKVKNNDARSRFAKKAASLVRTNDTLKSLKSSLEESPDPVIQKAIKEY